MVNNIIVISIIHFKGSNYFLFPYAGEGTLWGTSSVTRCAAWSIDSNLTLLPPLVAGLGAYFKVWPELPTGGTELFLAYGLWSRGYN